MTDLGGAARRSPLDAAHRALGAKMVWFGGWEMPLSYPSGTLAEHRACRQSAVAFDVSHLGTVRVEGPLAFQQLNQLLTNDLARIGPGRAQYSHLLDEADASVIDDLIVWWRATDRFDVIPNAANTPRVAEVVGGEDLTHTRALVAVQGPEARSKVHAVAPHAAAVPHFGVVELEWAGAACIAAGTGYTGEDGLELAVPQEVAERFWRALLDVGVAPAGLGARDTLRLEAGLPLHGNDLGPGVTPLQAGLGWVVAWDKGPFRGRAPLEAERRTGPHRRLRGLVLESRQPPRQGYTVVVGGKPAGTVTSGNYSPMLDRGIALAFLPPDVEPGAQVEVEIRGRLVRGQVVSPPFWRRGA